MTMIDVMIEEDYTASLMARRIILDERLACRLALLLPDDRLLDCRTERRLLYLSREGLCISIEIAIRTRLTDCID